MTFDQWLTARGFDPAKLSVQEKTLLQAAYDFEQKQPPVPIAQPVKPPVQAQAPDLTAEIQARADDLLKAMRDEAAAESARQAAIRRLCAGETALEIEVPALRDDGTEKPNKKVKVNLLEHAISAGWNTQQVELALLRATRARAPMGMGISTPAVDSRVLECAALQHGKYEFTDKDTEYPDKVQQLAHTVFKGRIGLQQLLTAAAAMNGYQGGEVIRDDATLLKVLEFGFRPEIRAESAAGYASLANLLANVQNKFLLQGYMNIDSSWRAISATRPVKDFKPTKSVALLGDFVYSQVGPDGELKFATMSDQAFANSANTYGRIDMISRTTIINDDLAGLTQVPQKLGRGAALKLNNVFWTLFMSPGNADDGVAFFSASHLNTGTGSPANGTSNLITGASSALSSASLASALKTFRLQVDPNGQPLGLEPRVCLVGPSNEITLLELMKGVNLVYGGASAAKQPNINVFAGRFQPAVSPYLENTSYTGNSTTAWYLFGDPMDIPVIETCFLNGIEQPTVQTAQAEFDKLGIAMRGFFDFGVAMVNFRGGIKSNGA